MVAAPRQTKTGGGKRGVYVYGTDATQRACGSAKASGGRGGVFILAAGADAFVTDAVLYRLRGLPAWAATTETSLSNDEALMSAIAADEAMLVELGEERPA